MKKLHTHGTKWMYKTLLNTSTQCTCSQKVAGKNKKLKKACEHSRECPFQSMVPKLGRYLGKIVWNENVVIIFERIGCVASLAINRGKLVQRCL